MTNDERIYCRSITRLNEDFYHHCLQHFYNVEKSLKDGARVDAIIYRDKILNHIDKLRKYYKVEEVKCE